MLVFFMLAWVGFWLGSFFLRKGGRKGLTLIFLLGSWGKIILKLEVIWVMVLFLTFDV